MSISKQTSTQLQEVFPECSDFEIKSKERRRRGSSSPLFFLSPPENKGCKLRHLDWAGLRNHPCEHPGWTRARPTGGGVPAAAAPRCSSSVNQDLPHPSHSCPSPVCLCSAHWLPNKLGTLALKRLSCSIFSLSLLPNYKQETFLLSREKVKGKNNRFSNHLSGRPTKYSFPSI